MILHFHWNNFLLLTLHMKILFWKIYGNLIKMSYSKYRIYISNWRLWNCAEFHEFSVIRMRANELIRTGFICWLYGAWFNDSVRKNIKVFYILKLKKFWEILFYCNNKTDCSNILIFYIEREEYEIERIFKFLISFFFFFNFKNPLVTCNRKQSSIEDKY